MAHGELADLDIYRDAERFCDRIYALVRAWPAFDAGTTGNQIVRAADSVGANIAESFGRYHYADRVQFLYYARGSAYETLYWIRRAAARGLLDAAVAERATAAYGALILSLNSYIRRARSRKASGTNGGASPKQLSESAATYAPDAPLDEEPF